LFHHFRNICLVALGVGSLTASVVAPAAAQTIDDKRAQALRLTAQIQSTNQELSAKGEELNAAQLQLDAADAQLAAAEAQVVATKAAIAALKEELQVRAAAVYRRAGTQTGLEDLDARSAQELASREQYAEAQSDADNALVDQLAAAKDDLSEQRDLARSARDDAAVVRDQVATTKAQLDALSAQQQALLAQVKGEIAQLIEDEMHRLEAQALALARATYGVSAGNYQNLPPPGPSTVKAIEFAYAQLGKTYVYAASGPDHYDCSGLVMAAFKSAGVNLPHYSGAQYAMFPKVPLDGMMRGDLIVWGSRGSSHVAIYLGDGKIIESGGTGHDVHVGPIWGKPFGAVRVTK